MPIAAPSTGRRRLIGVCIALACVGLVALLVGLTRHTSRPFKVIPCGLTRVTASPQSACWRPFVAGSPFNTRLPADPRLSPDNAAVVRQMVARQWSIDGSDSSFVFSPAAYGTRPVFFATPSDPVKTIRCKDDPVPGVCTGTNGIDVVGDRIHVPAGAMPDANADAHMAVIEQATGAVFDFWNTSVTRSTISAETAGTVNVKTGDGLGSQGDAGEFALSAGLLRPSELASGEIKHALVVTVPCTSGHGPKVGFTWPAVSGIGAACGPNGSAADSGAPAIGQLLRLNMTDAQIASSSAPSWQKTIMTALAHYGAYVEDTDGIQAAGIDILAQASSSWTDVGQADQWGQVLSLFGSTGDDLVSSVPIPVGDLEVVDPCVPRGTCRGATGSA